MSTRLAELPQFDPSPDLWERIAAAHAVRVRQRRLRVVLSFAAAAALALVVLWRLPHDASAPGLAQSHDPAALELAHLQNESQSLERELVALVPAEQPGSAATEAELERVERSMQLAYDHAANTNELVPLWKQRKDLLTVLVAMRRQGVMVSSI